ncbi:hypothetical protein CAPTEDRAFT_199259 [Capitella teleta]|uniref:Uncharacterized protein n=1 Tax=Capitella teleta TaxID=283909 RepID=R7UKK2_CAPTE|nr:hypothetical protein CAPTEDRAFT_199259 [Capitella teleta]|eukprot:ELU03812.1 hypothetical protein CAPTEDRAFT_199259 [Capitella teleta]
MVMVVTLRERWMTSYCSTIVHEANGETEACVESLEYLMRYTKGQISPTIMRPTPSFLTLVVCALMALVSANFHHDNDEYMVRNYRGSNTYNRLLGALLSRKPWMMLPDNGYCYQEPCKSFKDCCRQFNLCDKSARVCIDCWYGHPCHTSGDCCAKYPKCKMHGDGQGRCT